VGEGEDVEGGVIDAAAVGHRASAPDGGKLKSDQMLWHQKNLMA